jgi:hypothetical protein
MRGETPMLNTDVRSALGTDQSEREHLGALAALMVHVDVDHDSDQAVEIAVALAERFQAALIGVAGCPLWPAFMAGDVRLTNTNQYDFQKAMARFEQRGEKFCAQGRHLKQTEWRSMLVAGGYGHSRLGEWILAASHANFWQEAPFGACCHTEHRRSRAGGRPLALLSPTPGS